MFDTLSASAVGSYRRAAQQRGCVAAERSHRYEAVPARPTAQEALARLDAAVEALAQVDWGEEPDADLNAAVVRLQRQVGRVHAQALRPLDAMQRRESFKRDGAVTAASWLRNRANLDHAQAARLCAAARRLRGLPLLRDAFRAGSVTLAHVEAVTEAAVPTRFEAVSSVEAALVELACSAKPRAVRLALRKVREVADPDAVDPEALDPDEEPMDGGEDDPRRFWTQHRTLDGLIQGEYLVGGVVGEMLTVLFDAFSTADPADTPLQRRRTAGQKRADAMHAAVRALLDAGLAPTLQGNRAHLLLMIDLLTLLGRDSAATFAAELRRTGRVSAQTIAKLGLDARVTPVLTMGRWRVVAVGRTHRTLPPWLRPMLEMLHRRCRGPDCDRPACWSEAHHENAYADGGDTDLNQTVPACPAHHDLLTHGRWTMRMDRDTGVCTWTAPDGRIILTDPPP